MNWILDKERGCITENAYPILEASFDDDRSTKALQLALKAPEMLEMLETVLHDYRNYRQNILVDEYRSRRILLLEKLIKSATEI